MFRQLGKTAVKKKELSLRDMIRMLFIETTSEGDRL